MVNMNNDRAIATLSSQRILLSRLSSNTYLFFRKKGGYSSFFDESSLGIVVRVKDVSTGTVLYL